jgi:hypothetical protein
MLTDSSEYNNKFLSVFEDGGSRSIRILANFSKIRGGVRQKLRRFSVDKV